MSVGVSGSPERVIYCIQGWGRKGEKDENVYICEHGEEKEERERDRDGSNINFVMFCKQDGEI